MQHGLALFGLFLATTLYAQDEYRYAYLSHVEGQVSLQRASETEPEAGSLNVPILPGDRVWTRAGSRAEIRFGSGLVVRLSEGAKLDFVSFDSETILRLWSGSAILKMAETPSPLRIDSPSAMIRPTREGSYRIDVATDGAVTLAVERGSAELAAQHGSVLVQSGETSFASPTEPPTIPQTFNTASLDDFDRWSESREARTSRTQDIVVRSLPHAVQSYAYELDDHGDWYQEPDYGYVWYPQVDAGWAPYTYGHWGYTGFGHTWISSEPWGWAPYHYGRWGFGHRGWYWIPGATWGPAWVSFAIGPTWVGWSPLGFYGGPVFAFNTYFGGYGYGGYHGGYRHHRGGWNVCSRDDFRSGIVTRAGYRRLDPQDLGSSRSRARFVDEVTSLDRELNPRTARLRPSGFGEASPSRSSGFGEASSSRPSDFGQARPRSSGSGEASRATTSSRTEAALRGFRERAAGTRASSQVVVDSPRTSPGRVERDIPGPSDTRGRARSAPESFGSTPRRESTPWFENRGAERASPVERGERSRSRPLGTETPEAEGRERSAGTRERGMAPMFSAPSREFTREPRGESRAFTRSRAPETRSESRSRVERGEPRRESGTRTMGDSGRTSRGRSPSMGGSSSGTRGGGASRRSGGSQSQRGGGSARSRSNHN
jgi:hypothetical protein